MSLCLAFITARHEPRFDWLFESLAIQPQRGIVSEVIVIDFFAEVCDDWKQGDVDQRRNTLVNIARKTGFDDRLYWHPPKPTVWSGPHRLTPCNWWTAANSRNTAICYCRQPWIVFVDDRSVLAPTWLEGVIAALQGGYVVCGTYEKHHELNVRNGVVIGSGACVGNDHRPEHVKLNPSWHGTTNPHKAPGEWTFACSLGLPLEWALTVNGFDEVSDSLSGEDTAFGMMLFNNGFPIKLDLRMKTLQDRTPGHTGPVMKRTDKGISPADKSHAYLDNIRHSRRATHWHNIRLLREAALRGEPFPRATGPRLDWYDQQPIEEFK